MSPIPFADRQDRIYSRLDYVRVMALSIHAQHRILPVDDLVGWGCLGLIDACDRQDPSLPPESFESFCKSKIRGAMLDQVRREYARRESGGIDLAPVGLDAAFARVEAHEVLNQLPTKERQVIYLRLEGYSQEDIGRALGIGRPAAVRLERSAIALMRKLSRRVPVPVRKAA